MEANETLNELLAQQRITTKQVMKLVGQGEEFGKRLQRIESDVSELKENAVNPWINIEDGNGGTKMQQDRFNRLLYDHVKTGGICDNKFAEVKELVIKEANPQTWIQRIEKSITPAFNVIKIIGFISIVVAAIFSLINIDKFIEKW